MSDNRFSIDDILNEHPRKDVPKSSEPFDLDSILSGRGLDKTPSSAASQPVQPRRPAEQEVKPVQMAERPVRQEAKPVQMAERPVRQEAKPVQMAERPVRQEAKPVQMAERPVRQEAKPVQMAERPVRQEAKPVQMAERPVRQEAKPVQTAERPNEPLRKKSSFFETGAINPIDYKNNDLYMSPVDNSEPTNDLKAALDNSFTSKKPRVAKSTDGFGGAFSKDDNSKAVNNNENLSEFFGQGGFSAVEDEEDEGFFASMKKKISGLTSKKSKPAKTEAAKLEEYTAELPTQEALESAPKRTAKQTQTREKTEKLPEQPKPAPVKKAIDEPIKTIDLTQKKITLEVTGPIITEEKPAKKVKEKTGLFDRPQKKEQTGRLSFDNSDVKPIKTSEESDAGSEIVDNLNRIKKERGQHAAVIPPIERKKFSDIDRKLDDKILPNTEPIPIDESASEMQKLRELKERRKKKISDFVLVGDEEEDEEDVNEEGAEPREINDFESFEDAPSVFEDIHQLKNSLIVRFFFLLATLVASGYITMANDLGLPVIELLSKGTQPTTYLFINIILGLLSAFVSYTVISGGLIKLIKLKADCDSISAVAVVATFVSAVITLAKTSMVSVGIVNVYIAVAIASLLFNTIGKLLIVARTEKSFQYIAGDYEHYAVYAIDDEKKAGQFTRGALNDFPMLVSMRKTEFISDFLKNSYSTDLTDTFCKYAVPSICGVGLLCALLSLIFDKSAEAASSLFVALSTFAGSVSVCSCISSMLVVNLPMYLGTKKYITGSAAMLSYQSVEDFSDTNSVLLDVSQLFPEGMISLSAIKIFSDTRIDEAIVEAASLTSHSGSILKHMFYDIIAGKTEMLNPVESYIYEDSMGLCGWINNKRVLLGNRELMVNHSIEGMPTITREKEYTDGGKVAVYLSISGELSAMFIIEVKASAEVKRWMKEFEKNEICVILRTVDSIVSINKLAELFEISPDMLKLIPFRLHPEFDEATSYVPKQSASLACIGRFPSFAALIVGTKRIRKTAHIGITIQAAAGILGALIALALTVLSSFSQLTPTLALLYNLAWAAVTAIIISVRRT